MRQAYAGFPSCRGQRTSRERQSLLLQPPGQFFEIHGSKFKLHPVGYLGQASALGITHGVFLFCVGKDPFNGLLLPQVQFLVFGYVTDIVCQLFIVFPDMPLHHFDTIPGMGAQVAGGTPAQIFGSLR